MSLGDVMDAVDQMGGGPKLKAFMIGGVVVAAVMGGFMSAVVNFALMKQSQATAETRLHDLELWKGQAERTIIETHNDVRWIKIRLGGPSE